MHSLRYLIFGSFVVGIAGEVLVEKRDNITLPAPIVAVPSQHWEGIDGKWSTFEIRLGTPGGGPGDGPGGVYRVLPATSWQETWVVYGAAVGVCNTTLGVKQDCAEERGGVFDSAKSTTWNQTYTNASQNQYSLGLNEALGENGIGQYGFDTVGMGYTENDGPTLTHQIVSEIVSNTWWFGLLGLGFQPTNFTNYADPQKSFADTLWSNGTISSASWSYTAGAYYRLKNSLYGDLIFGGYDASRFTPNNLTFTMTGDNLRDIVVTIRSITSTTESGKTTLMSIPEFAFIDSTVPELWLPKEVCQEFEKAFGIKLDDTTGTYLVDNSTHQNLLDLNPNITLTLANQKEGGETIDIVLPYAAFDLSVSPPLLTNRTSFYFPLMQAADASQYTLGRTFLQEAYVTTHYNSRTFKVSQCIFSDTLSPHILALPSTLSSSSPNDNSTTSDGKGKNKPAKRLSAGAIAGIAISAIIVLLAIGAILFCCLRGLLCFRNRKTKNDSRPSTPVVEIDTGKRVEGEHVSQASAFKSEVSGQDAKVEIQGNPIMQPQELEADVPGSNMLVSKDGRKGGKLDGSGGGALSPVQEMKTPMAELGAQERGLGYGTTSMGERGVGREGLEGRLEGKDSLVSPNSEGNRESLWRGNGSQGRSSPAISERTWTPSSPVHRSRTSGSRFEERWDD